MQQSNKNPQKDQLSDLVDSPQDREKMNQDITEINLPDVNEIPGQKDFIPAPLGELADTTISSADEEGDDIFDDDIDEDVMDSPDSNVSPAEKDDLFIAANDMPGDDENLRNAALDNTDDDGTPLNEGSFKKNLTARDLDIPGAELDNDEENIGEEDEENNDYSPGGDNENIPRDDF